MIVDMLSVTLLPNANSADQGPIGFLLCTSHIAVHCSRNSRTRILSCHVSSTIHTDHHSFEGYQLMSHSLSVRISNVDASS